MKVIVPYVDLKPGVVEAIRSQQYDPECIDTSSSDHAYFDAIKEVWEEGEEFIVVEQDVLAPPGSLDSMASCSEPWCAVPYETHIGMICALGCTKFAPPLFDTPFFEGFRFTGGVDRRGWKNFDRGIEFWLEHHVGVTRHEHDEYEAQHLRTLNMSVAVADGPTDFLIYSVKVVKLWEGVSKEDAIKEFQASDADALVLLDPDQSVSRDAIHDALEHGTESEGMVMLRREG